MEEKAATKILKQIKFPGGKERRLLGYSWQDGVSAAFWHKSGGHAGRKVLSRVHEAAVAAGFEQEYNKTNMAADGSRSTTGTTLVHPLTNVKLHYTSHYGCTAYENRFDLTVTFPA